MKAAKREFIWYTINTKEVYQGKPLRPASGLYHLRKGENSKEALWG
jgi:hypothetical protein